MNIGKHIYIQTKRAIYLGINAVILAKTKRGYKNNIAKGKNFEIIFLKDIKNNFENGIFEINGRRLEKDEIIDLKNVRYIIKFNDLKNNISEFVYPYLRYCKCQMIELTNVIIPPLIYNSEILKEALLRKYWFHDKTGNGVEWIYKLEKDQGIVTYDNEMFRYRNKEKIITSNKRKDLIEAIRLELKNERTI